MRYFIDTNVLINLIEDNCISDKVDAIINDYENIIYISSECVREFIQLVQAGKVADKKNNIKIDIFDFVENTLGFIIKYIAKEHLRTFAALETIDGHNDPFDRLIIAQAKTEKIPLISSDKQFPKYRKYGLDFISNY
ncbi:MAG: type II toxin-antitoxin system VapC family toxin [Paludibacter sp.]|nr:type II toxin-antitoxin system VapC family toxin [Paludibacter sp.]